MKARSGEKEGRKPGWDGPHPALSLDLELTDTNNIDDVDDVRNHVFLVCQLISCVTELTLGHIAVHALWEDYVWIFDMCLEGFVELGVAIDQLLAAGQRYARRCRFGRPPCRSLLRRSVFR